MTFKTTFETKPGRTARLLASAGLLVTTLGLTACDDKTACSTTSSDAGLGLDANGAVDAPAMDATSSPGGTAGGGNGGGGNGAVGNPAAYVPDTIVPYDGKYLPGGSIEDNPGFGWDRCYTHTPGLAVEQVSDQASNGTTSMVFESGGCTMTCAASNPSSSQIYFTFSAAPPSGDPVGLYFDVMNLKASAPTGTMVFYATDLVCRNEQKLLDVPLADLNPGSTWSTRCVNLALPVFPPALGIAMSAGAYKVAVDALRLGAPCQKPKDCLSGCVCQPGQNQSCNENLAVSSLRGACLPDGTCLCHPGVAKNTTTGKCL